MHPPPTRLPFAPLASLPAVQHLSRLSSFPIQPVGPPQAARQLLTLDTKDPKRLFEGPALLRRMARFGLLGEDERELDFVLQLTTEKMLERRLQTKVCLRCWLD